MNSKVYPVTNRVILIPDPVKEDQQHGLIVPDDSKELPNYATVYSVGPLCTQVKEGDRVIYPHKYGSHINIDGKDHLIMKEADLWAVVYTNIHENCGGFYHLAIDGKCYCEKCGNEVQQK